MFLENGSERSEFMRAVALPNFKFLPIISKFLFKKKVDLSQFYLHWVLKQVL